MKQHPLRIEAELLRLNLKTTVRHASAVRNKGESILVQAKRNEKTGYGEGCPRVYVTGDDIDASLAWIKTNFSSGKVNFVTLAELKQWSEDNEKEIDNYPSAWCAIEMALLDLLSREKGCSVEKILGLKDGKLCGRYTAVLGDDPKRKYTALVVNYLIRGISDFKIKLSGKLKRDIEKLDILEKLSVQHLDKPIRIRLDANNLWKDCCDEAIKYTKKLGIERIFAVEEPVGAKNVENISRFSTATGLPVILDESLCIIEDLSLYRNIAGKFIANIKVSKVGGLIRALKIIEELKKMGWPIIIGCHVGETSLLTRAALVVSGAAGDRLIAHEGAFGDYLVEREPVSPMLKFGHQGLLDLNSPYSLETDQGLKIISTENWKIGLGMQCSIPITADREEESLTLIRKSR
jgi:L-alanine-DL-glutamate epimerase-like enolase superfamily enzyme